MAEPKRILCVEDDADIRAIMQFSLARLGGHQVLLCAGGQEALDQAVAFAPDLVLLDVMMPGIDGPETLRRLRELAALREVPVVFVTAKAMQVEIAALRNHGVAGIIVKPFDPVRLPHEVQAYLDGSHD